MIGEGGLDMYSVNKAVFENGLVLKGAFMNLTFLLNWDLYGIDYVKLFVPDNEEENVDEGK